MRRTQAAFDATPLGKRLNKYYFSRRTEAAIHRAKDKLEKAMDAFVMKHNPRGLPSRRTASVLRSQRRRKAIRRAAHARSR